MHVFLGTNHGATWRIRWIDMCDVSDAAARYRHRSSLLCAGSPFRATVVSADRVELVGGWESVLDARTKSLRLALHEPCSLEFNTRAAGPGALARISVQNPID